MPLLEIIVTRETAPWVALAPGVALSLTVLAINWLADGIDRATRH